MLSVGSAGYSRDCEGYSRRDFLQIGALGLGGLTLPELLAARARAAGEGHYVRKKSVIFLFLHGGASHIETWDPKMTAPSNIRSMMGEVKTKLPGVTFGGTFPKLGSMADKMAVVRSFKVGTGSHGTGRKLVVSAGNSLGAPLGSVYSQLAGTTAPASGMPSNILLTPQSAGAQYKSLDNRASSILDTGKLSPEHRPFVPTPDEGGKGNGGRGGQGLLSDMQLRLPVGRLDDRRRLLQELGNLQRGLDRSGAVEQLDRYRQQAFEVIVRGVKEAFDLEKEDPRLVQKYDTGRFDPGDAYKRKKTKNAKKIPRFSPVALGKQLLLARRLCEAGCGYVTVTNHGWDMHGNAFGIDDGMPCLGAALDHGVSTLLEDLEQRGMSDDVLLVISGEMGRTPKINKKAGRDHWANICSLALAGGGLKMGQVVGESDRTAGRPASNPVSLDNLLATIMHTLFDVGALRVARGLPTDLLRAVTTAEPIRELV